MSPNTYPGKQHQDATRRMCLSFHQADVHRDGSPADDATRAQDDGPQDVERIHRLPPPPRRHGGDGVTPIKRSGSEGKEGIAAKRAVSKPQTGVPEKAAVKKAAARKTVTKKK